MVLLEGTNKLIGESCHVVGCGLVIWYLVVGGRSVRRRAELRGRHTPPSEVRDLAPAFLAEMLALEWVSRF